MHIKQRYAITFLGEIQTAFFSNLLAKVFFADKKLGFEAKKGKYDAFTAQKAVFLAERILLQEVLLLLNDNWVGVECKNIQLLRGV
jgi:hypothetical protein